MKQILVISTLVLGCTAIHNFADVKCGRKGKSGRIVGGGNAFEGEFPWMVSITRRGGHFCGGTVLNSKFILTAAHCLCSGVGSDIVKPSHIKVTLAQHDLTQKSSDAYEASFKALTIHPDYVCNKPSNDIAILELEQELQWSESVAPACLPSATENRNIDNTIATVAGWGWTNEDNALGSRAKVLQKAKVNVIDNDKCRQWYKSQGKKTKIQDTQICAGHEQGGIDACWADSGGPLMVSSEKANQMIVVGVVSTGIGCARPLLPGLYTRVIEYIPWIRKIIAG